MNSRYFVGVFNETIIPLVLVRYEMIIANSALRASLAIHQADFATERERQLTTARAN